MTSIQALVTPALRVRVRVGWYLLINLDKQTGGTHWVPPNWKDSRLIAPLIKYMYLLVNQSA